MLGWVKIEYAHHRFYYIQILTFFSLHGHFTLVTPWIRDGVVAITAFTLAAILGSRAIRNRVYEFFLVTHIILILYVKLLYDLEVHYR